MRIGAYEPGCEQGCSAISGRSIVVKQLSKHRCLDQATHNTSLRCLQERAHPTLPSSSSAQGHAPDACTSEHLASLEDLVVTGGAVTSTNDDKSEYGVHNHTGDGVGRNGRFVVHAVYAGDFTLAERVQTLAKAGRQFQQLVHISGLDENILIGKQFVLVKGRKLERATEAKAGNANCGDSRNRCRQSGVEMKFRAHSPGDKSFR